MAHEERAAGESKYSFYRLMRLNFDLVTGFSLVPLQLFSLLGMLVAIALGAALCRGADRARCSPAARWPSLWEALWDRDMLRVLPHRHRALRPRPGRRVRRPHLRAGARPAALPRQRGAGEARLTSAAVVRLPRRRRALPAGAARRGDRRAAGGHAPRRPGGAHLVRERRRARPRPRPRDAARSGRGRARAPRARGGAGFHLLLLLPPHAAAGAARARAARRLQHARLAAAEVPRPRAGELGGAARRDARPAPRCTKWWTKPDAGRIVDQQAVPIGPDDRRSRCSAR